MARKITIPLSDALEAQVQAEAAARGGQSLDECVLALLTEALVGPRRVPGDNRALEAELRKGLDGPGRTPTARDWNRKKDDLNSRHQRNQAG
jgi:hypothetical protein